MVEQGTLDEVRAALPAMRDELQQQAGPRGVKNVLEEWYTIFPQPQRSDAEWAMFYKGYAEICGPMSRSSLRAAMRSWAQKGDSQFLPKPGELRALALAAPTTGHRLYAKAKAAVDAADSEAERQRIEDDIKARGTTAAEQALAVRHMMAQYDREAAPGRKRANDLLKHGVRASGAGVRPLPPTGGIPAPGSALSPVMQAHLMAKDPEYVPPPATQGRPDDEPPVSEFV